MHDSGVGLESVVVVLAVEAAVSVLGKEPSTELLHRLNAACADDDCCGRDSGQASWCQSVYRHMHACFARPGPMGSPVTPPS